MRQDRLDALRGVWMLWMAAFHFCFDLANFRLTDWNFYTDPVWTVQRSLILSGFLFFAGWGQGLALQAGQSAERFWRRWLQIAVAAALVSAGSMLIFPRSWISFGVLHAFVVLLPLLRFGAARFPSWAVFALAALAVLLPLWLQDPIFDNRWLNGIGLVTRKPITEDYVPLLPWAGPMLLGLLASRHLHWQGRAPAALVQIGRWPLLFYLLHQPLFIGGLLLWQAL